MCKISKVKKKLSEDEIYKKYGADNLLGGILIESPHPDYTNYLLHFYDLINYMTLLETKLQIKQAGISKAQVPAFLQKLGDKAQNPYSKKPFVWDSANQILFSEWLELGGYKRESDGGKAETKIRF